MSKTMNPIEPEELMGYLDGELSAERAAETAAHLGECAECGELVSELRGVSKGLHSWKIQDSQLPMSTALTSVLKEHDAQHRTSTTHTWRKWHYLRWPKTAWAVGLATVGVLIIISISVPNLMRSRESADRAHSLQFDRLEQFAKLQKSPPGSASLSAGKPRVTGSLLAPEEQEAKDSGGGGGDAARLSSGPMIIRTAELSLTTKDFDKVRARLEEILKRHRGYVGELKVGGATRSGRILTATSRVSADQVDGTLTELKTLGRVESESQGGQDVTSQYVDLQARLENARNTEKRLTDLLGQRTGKLSDVLEVEQEVDRVRGEIERMEAERKNMSNQVSFATLNVSVSEEYKAQLEAVPPSTATRLSNAAVEGYRSLVDGVVDVILFLLSNGPSWLFWGALLFVPARFAWKTMRRRYAE